MSLSRPPSTEALDEGWALFEDEPAPDSDNDSRTVQRESPFFQALASRVEKTSDERDTVPPPVPAAEYVQTMMEQAKEEPPPSAHPSSTPLSVPFAWHSAMPPSSRRGDAFPASSRRPDLPPPSERMTVPSMRAPIFAPPPPPPPPEDDDADSGSFTLIAFEPERLGDAPAPFERPRFDDELTLSPDFEDLPLFDTASSDAEPAASPSLFPTPVPVFPSSRAEPASIPPILDMAWATVTADRRDDFAHLDDVPRTNRGLAAPSAITRPELPRFGSLDDVGDLDAPSSSRREPLAEPSSEEPTELDPLAEVRALYEAGDFRSALVLAESLLEADPDDFEADSYAVLCRETLLKKYLGRLGGHGKIPRVAMPPDEIRWLSLDHKAGFLLACIDGTSTIEEVLDVSCMQEFEAIRILHDFRELGVIEILPGLRSPRR